MTALKKALGLLALVVALGAGPVAAAPEYSFGVVPQFEPRQLASIWVPILKALEARTGFTLKMDGAVNIPDFEIAFQSGRFDFAYMNPWHSLVALRTQGYQPLVRDGGRTLSGILVTRKDGGITSVKDLEGKTIAFPAPNALGASLLMRADLETIFGVSYRPLYVSTHSSVYANVLVGRAAAGGGVMSTLNNQKPEVRDALRIVYKTREMAPHPVVAHPRVPESDRLALQRAFLELGATEEGAALLAKVPIKRVVKASEEDYTPLSEWGLERFFVKE